VVAKDEDGVEVDAIWLDGLRQPVSMFPGFGTRFYRSPCSHPCAKIAPGIEANTSRDCQQTIAA
jgi:hypothetical protein